MPDEKATLEQAAASQPAITLEPAEPAYTLPPHPEARIVSNAKTVTPDEPTVADETLGDMVRQAVLGLRGEIKAELQQEQQLERGGIGSVKG